ncbi:MAG TPA: hypothetical protein VFJ58_26540 [Armatimonadota bacterium]|nr:hypothetical protein [Armatimonadota bacterium]
MNTLQQSWFTTAAADQKLTLLGAEGRRFVVRRNREMAEKYRMYRTGLWPFCVAEALVESTHARDAGAWYPAAAQFLKTGKRADLTPARGHSSSFGADALQRALISFQTIGEFTGAAGLGAYDAARLVDAQTRAVQYAMKQPLTGLGAWLFCAPFELMALLKPSLWESAALNDLLLPLGSALARGYGILRKEGLVDVDEELLRDTEPGIRNGITLLYIARGCDQKLAARSGARALFIHHGIQLLGQAR